MTEDLNSDPSNKAFTALLRRETVILIVLAAATVPLFLFTRTMAAWNRESNAAAGRAWYERAREPLKQGLSVTAIDYLRKAAAADRDNIPYSLSLAEALIAAGETDEARQILQRLRTSKPEDGRVNLDLARLSVKDDDAENARRYYHQALYGTWPGAQAVAQQATVRMELARYLVTSHDTSNAVSELLILAAGNPTGAGINTELGQLFLEVDEPGRALNQFLGALNLQPMNAEAMTGAGEAEFKLGNDLEARKRLQNAADLGPLPAEAQHAFDIASLIVSDDPLISGIRTQERLRRLKQALQRATDRLDTCNDRTALSDPGLAVILKSEASRIIQQISNGGVGADLDLLRDGLKIATRAELAGTEACGPLPAAEEAIVLAANRHQLNTP